MLATAIVHLAFVPIGERAAAAADGTEAADGKQPTVDLRGTVRVVRGVPGLTALIVFSAFNNLLGGVFIAIIDAYGLSLVSVQVWGLLWGVLSTAFIVGGLLIAKPASAGTRSGCCWWSTWCCGPSPCCSR